MTRNDSQYRLRNQYLKMAKTKSVILLLMIITACAVIFSISDAYPTSGEEIDSSAEGGNSSENSTILSYDGNATGSSAGPKDPKLVITHVVKTLEFEVDEVDSDENSTESTEKVTTYEETDIKLLDVNLLRELVSKMPTGYPSTESGNRFKKSAEESIESNESDEKEESGKKGEKTEGSTEKSSTGKGGGD